MPATAQALSVTEEYRARLTKLTEATQRKAKAEWRDVDFKDLRRSYGPVRVRIERAVRAAQTEAVRMSAGYVSAFLSAELGERAAAPHMLTVMYVGKSFGGLPLYESLQKPLTVVLVAIRDKKPDPMGLGLSALLVNVDLDVKNAARRSLMDAIATDDRIAGWDRAIRGTCGACAGAAGRGHGVEFPVHPGCQCVSEPVVDAKSPKDVVPKNRQMPALRDPVTIFRPLEIPEHPLFSHADMASVQEYVGSTAAMDINAALRSGAASEFSTAIDGLDAALSKAGSLGQPTRVLRGLQQSPEELGMETGKTFTEKAYSSALGDPEDLAYLARARFDATKVFMDMNVDPRVKAIWGANPGESELLMERGCRYVIRSIEKDGDTWRIQAEVLPPE